MGFIFAQPIDAFSHLKAAANTSLSPQLTAFTRRTYARFTGARIAIRQKEIDGRGAAAALLARMPVRDRAAIRRTHHYTFSSRMAAGHRRGTSLYYFAFYHFDIFNMRLYAFHI